MLTSSLSYPQEENEVIELPEDLIDPQSDPFNVLTPAEPFWRNKRPDSYQETVTKTAILLAWGRKRIGAVEAFNALIEHDLLDLEAVMWMIAQQHRCAQIIEGGE